MSQSSLPESTSPPEAPPWHACEVADTLARLASCAQQGLTEAEAQQRLQQYGPNRLPEARGRSIWQRILLQFDNLLIYIMLASSVVTALLGHWLDTSVLLGAVLINAAIGFVQDGKAETALNAIRGMLTPYALVLRDGVQRTVPAEVLVPGDVVILASGDKVPADLRLISARGVRADESVLTGESVPSSKDIEAVSAEATLADRRSMLYSGTLLAAGAARGVVVATARETELGRISSLLAQVKDTTTPLLQKMAHFSRWLALVILVFVAITFVIGVLLRGAAPSEMFMMAVALAASAIPEGLPAIMTITLALGVRRMARHNAIIRHLPAVETLGSVTIICSDKTGTLTCNEMTTQRVITPDHVYEVSGSGYAPEGGFQEGNRVVVPGEAVDLQALARVALLCNDAAVTQTAEGWGLSGDPTEGALVTLALKAGLEHAAERAAYPRLDAIPFESENLFMATLHPDGEQRVICLKGAPERLLALCSVQATWQDGHLGYQPVDHDYWRRAINDCAARALRVLALAIKRVHVPDTGEMRLEQVDVENGGFVLLGLVGSIDPPRPEAIAAVAECQTAGVRVKMITGDHVETARAIGAQLGIGVGRPGITGAELELLDDEQLRSVVQQVDVFARASPEHKLRLVQAMQANGDVVAMTGDGVNDAPALKRADVGVAMGKNGTEAAKEAAAMVLLDDNFSSLSRAVREGRSIYDNIKKFILFMLPTNGGEALVVFTAIAFGLTLPMTAAQVLWINLVTSSTLGLALAFEPSEDNVMHRPPRSPQEALLSGFFVWRLVLVSVLMATAALGLFLWEMAQGASIETARTMAVSVVVAAEAFYLFNSRHYLRSALSREGLFGNPHVLMTIAACVLLQLVFVYSPWLQQVFGSTALSGAEWLRVILCGLGVFAGVELEKWLRRQSLAKFAAQN